MHFLLRPLSYLLQDMLRLLRRALPTATDDLTNGEIGGEGDDVRNDESVVVDDDAAAAAAISPLF